MEISGKRRGSSSKHNQKAQNQKVEQDHNKDVAQEIDSQQLNYSSSLHFFLVGTYATLAPKFFRLLTFSTLMTM